MKKLTGIQYKQLSYLIREFFTPAELEWLLRTELDFNIADITLANNYQGVVFDVIGDSQRKGWTPRLINALKEARPEDDKLFAFSQQFNLAPNNTPTRPALEKIIDNTNTFLNIATWRQNLGRVERQVCAIRINGKPAGTGFLLGPDVIMTNYHVVNDVIDKKIGTDSVRVIFDYKQLEDGTTLNDGVDYGLADKWLIDYSPYSSVDWVAPNERTNTPRPDELDYALVRLNGSPGNTVFGDPKNPDSPLRGWLKPQEAPHDFVGSPALFIAQHPEGEPLKLALDTESVLSVNGNQTRVLYRTNTEPGSSGSPCFDQDWRLVALHHSGDTDKTPTWNEGIPFTAITNLLKDRGKLGELDKQTGDSDNSKDEPSDDDVAASFDEM